MCPTARTAQFSSMWPLGGGPSGAKPAALAVIRPANGAVAPPSSGAASSSGLIVGVRIIVCFHLSEPKISRRTVSRRMGSTMRRLRRLNYRVEAGPPPLPRLKCCEPNGVTESDSNPLKHRTCASSRF
jgi:hypothetical protein